MTSIPRRMPTLSLTQPISGSSARPGMAHQDAMENPTALARAGIASDSDRQNAGQEDGQRRWSAGRWRSTATTRMGASANTATSTAAVNATPRRKRKMSAGSAEEQADSQAGADGEAEQLERLDRRPPGSPAGARRGGRRRRSTRLASETNPTSEMARNGTAYQMRRSTSIFQTIRHDSEKLGMGSSVSTTSSLIPAARRSWAPRTGSFMRVPSTARISGRDREDEERGSPAEGRGQDAGHQRAEELAQDVRGAVEGEHRGPSVDGVVVRQERVVDRVHGRLTDARPGSGQDQHPRRGGHPGEDREHRPGQRAEHVRGAPGCCDRPPPRSAVGGPTPRRP